MGRGSSKAGPGGGNSIAVKSGGSKLSHLQKGLYVEGSLGQYEEQAAKVLQGAKDVLADFGAEKELRGVYYSEKGVWGNGADASASMNGMGNLRINPKSLKNPENRPHVKGELVSDTFYGTGAHEAGHAVVNYLLKNKVDINENSRLAIATARHLGKLEHEIIKEAKKRNGGKNPSISRYGSTKVSEKVAEAVSDVYANKDKANPYSKIIVDVMKDINNGKFTPKIKVTDRQMGR